MEHLDGMPKILYKYRTWDDSYHKRMLTESEVFLASPANLNDPFDASLPFRYSQAEMTPENIFKKLIEVARRDWPEKSESELHTLAYERQMSGVFEDGSYWKDVHVETKNNVHQSFGILSLARNNDNLLMWAHYANGHKGFCVGLDTDILYKTVKGILGPVIYDDVFPELPLFGGTTQSILKMLTTKSVHWRYEEEFRLTQGESANKAYVLPIEAIKEIALGCNMPIEQRKEIYDVIEENLPHVKLYEAQINNERFKLDMNFIHKIP